MDEISWGVIVKVENGEAQVLGTIGVPPNGLYQLGHDGEQLTAGGARVKADE